MIQFFSIKTRLTLLYMTAFLVVLTLIFTTMSMQIDRELTDRIDGALEREAVFQARRIKEQYGAFFRPGQGISSETANKFTDELDHRFENKDQFALFISGTRVMGSGILKSPPPELISHIVENGEGIHTDEIQSRHYSFLVREYAWGTMIIGMSDDIENAVSDFFLDLLLKTAPVALVLIFMGGFLMAGFAMKPVRKAAEAAEKISISSPGRRMPPYSGKDEFGILIDTLNRMLARIESGVRRIQVFTQDAAHELRTPLTVLRGELEKSYQDEELPEITRLSLERSLERTIQMGQLVDNLLLLVQSDTGDYPLEKRSFRLDHLLSEIQEDLEILTQGRPLAVFLERCDPVSIHGDKALVYRLLLNLCENALKYTEKGSISLTLVDRPVSENVEITITDTGIGIPADQLSHIFDRFHRVDRSRSRSTGGSGLGLSICKWIVEAHGGKIQIESVVSEGTRVGILLPR